MLKKFFILFASTLAIVLILGSLLIISTSHQHVVDFWVLMLIPSFAIPILTAVIFAKTEEDHQHV